MHMMPLPVCTTFFTEIINGTEPEKINSIFSIQNA